MVWGGVDRAYVWCGQFDVVLGCVTVAQACVPHFLKLVERVQNFLIGLDIGHTNIDVASQVRFQIIIISALDYFVSVNIDILKLVSIVLYGNNGVWDNFSSSYLSSGGLLHSCAGGQHLPVSWF